MKPTFLNHKEPLLTVMIQTKTPESAIETIRAASAEGADAFGLQVCRLDKQYQNRETYEKIFAELNGKPIYVTNYRYGNNEGLSDDVLADGILELARSGATLCDVMGDIFCKHPEELTEDAEAVKKQIELIDKLHAEGAEVLMSSHLFKYSPPERVLEIALEQERRGADVVKIVTNALSPDEEIENLRATAMLKKELKVPFLFLSNHLHRVVGPYLGGCMWLCVHKHDELSTKSQLVLRKIKLIKDNFQCNIE